MINIIRNIFTVIGIICTAGSAIVALSCMWEGWKENHESSKDVTNSHSNNNWNNFNN